VQVFGLISKGTNRMAESYANWRLLVIITDYSLIIDSYGHKLLTINQLTINFIRKVSIVIFGGLNRAKQQNQLNLFFKIFGFQLSKMKQN